MSNTFFDESRTFPDSLKVRLPKGKPARVFIHVLDLGNGTEQGEAEFEVAILDRSGYMQTELMRFGGIYEGKASHEVLGLSINTSAVYIMPTTATNPKQQFQVVATA